jgi:N-acyl-D-aspartate/D-glutamate deacylase
MMCQQTTGKKHTMSSIPESSTPDLVIRGGTIADGQGGDLFEADIAISNGRITQVGKIAGRGKEEIEAKGKLVTPGFVDVHTHYDGQVTWSQDITPSSQNGVTTAIMGNCGVGFAPCKPTDHERLIQLMEGVEDIPEPVLSAGIPWSWESFPDYMDWLSKRSFDVDIGAQLPHAALRVYVMGERGARRNPSTAEDNKAMASLAGDAVRAGALGFSTSRTLNHRTSTGDFTPDLEGGRGRIDCHRRRNARGRPQRAAVRARPLYHPRRPADDAASGRENRLPDLVLGHAERQGAATLASDAGQHQ